MTITYAPVYPSVAACGATPIQPPKVETKEDFQAAVAMNQALISNAPTAALHDMYASQAATFYETQIKEAPVLAAAVKLPTPAAFVAPPAGVTTKCISEGYAALAAYIKDCWTEGMKKATADKQMTAVKTCLEAGS